MKEKNHGIKKGVRKITDKVKIPFRKLAKTKGMKAIYKALRIPFIGHMILALLLNFCMEMLSRHSVEKTIVFIKESPVVFLYNAFIIFVTLSLVVFAKRKLFATIFVCMIWIVSAFANFIVLSFRTTPFSAIDILMIRNVMTMLDKYVTKKQLMLGGVGVGLLIILLIYLYIKLPKTKKKRNPFRASVYVCMCCILAVTLTRVAVSTHTVSDKFGNLAYAYNDYGFAYCFSNSIIDVGITKPKDYNEKTIKDIVDGLQYDKSEVITKTREEDPALLAEGREAAEQGGELTKEPVAEQGGVDTTEKAAEQDDGKTKEPVAEQGGVDTTEKAAEQDDGKTKEAAEQDGVETTEAVTEKDTEITTEIDTKEEAYFINQKATKQYPNIIVIQLESVFDTKYMKNFYASENPMPTLARLKRRYSSGLFTVPAVGAGTANTEFEVQTGMSTQFFGAGEYPFKTIMRSTTCDTMAYDLKRIGYATAGFHNNDATFYERHVDYFNLGFDTFSGMEHMYNLNYTPRGWAKDDVLDDLMVERIKQTEGRDYITTITVQAHGRYPKRYTKTLHDMSCYFTGEYKGDTEKQAAWQYYINMCKETDDMIKSLIDQLEELREPTVVFMYGDHLPSLNLQESDLDDITLYQTEWVMWDNIGLKKEKKNMTSYQASTYIFNRLDLPGGLMQNFHNKYMNHIGQDDYLNKLELLEYDTLYGSRYAYDGENPFPRMETKMGIRDISLNKYRVIGNDVWIYGTGFNEFSEVYVDGNAIETTCTGYTTLKVSLEDFKKGREFYIAQAGDDHLVLSTTEPLSISEKDINDRIQEEMELESRVNTESETGTEGDADELSE